MPLFMTFPALISFLLILSHGFITGAQTQNDNNGTDLFGTACAATKVQNDNNETDPFRTACAVWKIPTEAKPMRIGVPPATQFQKFVKVNPNETSDEKKYEGFCIDIFKEVLKVLYAEKNYTLHYKFEIALNDNYTQLVEGVANKTFDAAVGDITILANRSKHVEFTHPYMESRLVMIAPVKSQHKAWKFLKPLTMDLWLATGGILTYTVFIVWLLEHRTNPEFEGSWKDQLCIAFWFTFSSLFFAHRERVHSNFTRVVVVIWLFVVLILSSSYTANLSATLTVSQLEPKVTSIELLKKTNSTVGCDAGSFIEPFLKSEYGFRNIKKIRNDNDYVKEFESGKISAAFFELPYGKDFMSRYNKGYIMTEPVYRRFGGLGFVFQKCSPIATNVSEAILTLLEKGELKMLENKWFGNSCENSDFEAANKSDLESLNLQSFRDLYLVAFATSTILALIHLLNNYLCRATNYVATRSFQSFWGLYLVTNTSTILFLIHSLRNYRRSQEEHTSPANAHMHLQASPPHA